MLISDQASQDGIPWLLLPYNTWRGIAARMMSLQEERRDAQVRRYRITTVGFGHNELTFIKYINNHFPTIRSSTSGSIRRHSTPAKHKHMNTAH